MTLGFNSTLPFDSHRSTRSLSPHTPAFAPNFFSQNAQAQNLAQHLPVLSITYKLLLQHHVYFHILTNCSRTICLTFTSLQIKDRGVGC